MLVTRFFTKEAVHFFIPKKEIDYKRKRISHFPYIKKQKYNNIQHIDYYVSNILHASQVDHQDLSTEQYSFSLSPIKNNKNIDNITLNLFFFL